MQYFRSSNLPFLIFKNTKPNTESWVFFPKKNNLEMRERNTKNIYTKIEKMESEMYHEEVSPKEREWVSLKANQEEKMRVSILKSSFDFLVFWGLPLLLWEWEKVPKIYLNLEIMNKNNGT